MQSVMRVLVVAAAIATPLVATAQPIPAVTCDGVAEFPCSFQIGTLRLQKAPALLKLQARVSQARLPIGEGIFNTLWVKLLRGTDLLCLEQFENVHVRESVLNLEIGHGMSCEMDAVIAENTGLAFQICLGGLENCLRPIELAATPYAIKASYASLAQSAHEANIAGQAHYAHRATADREMFIRNELGTGYFDFFTHPVGARGTLYPNEAEYLPFQNGGFIQWAPVRDRGANTLHISGKDHAADALRELDTLVLASEDTYATGDLTVQPPAGGKGLTVTRRGAHITGDSDITGTLRVSQNTRVENGGVDIEAGGLRANGGADIFGASIFHAPLRFGPQDFANAPVTFEPNIDHLFVRGRVVFETPPEFELQLNNPQRYPWMLLEGEDRPILPSGPLQIARPGLQPGVGPLMLLQDAVNELRILADGIVSNAALRLQVPGRETIARGPLVANEALRALSDVEVGGQVGVDGNLTVNGQLLARSDGQIDGNLAVTGDLTVASDLTVGGEVETQVLSVNEVANVETLHVHGNRARIEVPNALTASGRLRVEAVNCTEHWWDEGDRAVGANGVVRWDIACDDGKMLMEMEVANVARDGNSDDLEFDRNGNIDRGNASDPGDAVGGLIQRYKCCALDYVLQ